MCHQGSESLPSPSFSAPQHAQLLLNPPSMLGRTTSIHFWTFPAATGFLENVVLDVSHCTPWKLVVINLCTVSQCCESWAFRQSLLHSCLLREVSVCAGMLMTCCWRPHQHLSFLQSFSCWHFASVCSHSLSTHINMKMFPAAFHSPRRFPGFYFLIAAICWQKMTDTSSGL